MSAVDTGALLAEAVRHHGAGDLTRADALYRRVLAVDPEHPDALHLHGVVAHQRGRHQAAVEHIRRAVEHRPGHHG
jgi:Flp pilus assembly protein TadD